MGTRLGLVGCWKMVRSQNAFCLLLPDCLFSDFKQVPIQECLKLNVHSMNEWINNLEDLDAGSERHTPRHLALTLAYHFEGQRSHKNRS